MVIVKRSPISGLGLYATKDFKRGDFIIEYQGKKVSNEEADEKFINNRYIIVLNNTYCIDGSSRTNRARYINHSCKPNSEAISSQRSVKIYAKRRIKVGEEITIDYGKEYREFYLNPCRCEGCIIHG